MSLEGSDEGTGGRGFKKERGVLGGSMLGLTFFHASTKLESAAAAETSVEKHRDLAAVRRGRRRRLNMAVGVGIARVSQGRREKRRALCRV